MKHTLYNSLILGYVFMLQIIKYTLTIKYTILRLFLFSFMFRLFENLFMTCTIQEEMLWFPLNIQLFYNK